MRTDYHCHVLPAIDDGAKTTDVSVQMLEAMHSQGVERIVATPHFYAHREKSVRRFLEKRQQSYKRLMSAKHPYSELILGAEIAIERGISELEGIDKLAISGTDLILLEFPYGPYADWMSEEIHNIACEYHLTPVIAHIHRYIRYFSKAEMENILKTDAVFQINNEAFGTFREKRFVKALMKREKAIVFGSDSHNMSSRRPNFDLLVKKASPECIEASDKLLDKHLKNDTIS